jgi:hypothetical protein
MATAISGFGSIHDARPGRSPGGRLDPHRQLGALHGDRRFVALELRRAVRAGKV